MQKLCAAHYRWSGNREVFAYVTVCYCYFLTSASIPAMIPSIGPMIKPPTVRSPTIDAIRIFLLVWVKNTFYLHNSVFNNFFYHIAFNEPNKPYYLLIIIWAAALLICHILYIVDMPRGVKKGVSKQKFERTVNKIKRKGNAKNPYAVVQKADSLLDFE